jgi:tRNA(Ile)-lysidine synthase
MRLDPVVAAQRRAMRDQLADLPPGSTVLVACSGGPDSLALAAALAFVGPRAGWRSGAVVVDHQLQPGSSEVAVRAAAQCRDLGLDPVEVVTVDVTAGGGPEGAARAARYAALASAAERHAAAALLLGHTMDDQAETVLLGLARGSGARSLAGMADRRGLLRRPFLGVRRTATAHACEVLGLRPWQDPSNGPDVDGGPVRSRLRHEVLPVLEEVLGPGVVPALARTADQLREDADVLDALAGQAAEGLDADALAALPTALRRRVLRTALLDAGVPGGSLARAHLAAVDALVTDWHGQAGLDLPGGIHVVRRCGRLTVARG